MGFSKNYIRDAQLDSKNKDDIEKMSLTMKFQEKSKAICMFQENGIFEIIETEPSSLTPIDNLVTSDEQDLSFLDDANIIKIMVNTLIKATPQNYE